MSFIDFVRYMRPEYIESEFSRTVCAAIDQFLDDMLAERRPVLVLSAPPQHGKSELVSRLLPAYALGRITDLRVGGVSYAASLAQRMNRAVQTAMMSDAYANLFPESSLNPRRSVTRDGMPRRNNDEFELVGKPGSYLCAGVGGAITGLPIDLGIIDDPIKNAEEAVSIVRKDGVWDWYNSTFTTRLSKRSGQIIMATRWALDDLTGRVLDTTPRAQSLVFQAIDDEGRALVPELHPIEKLEDQRSRLSAYYWSALYQNNPIPDGGGDFDTDRLQFVDLDELPRDGVRYVRGWDLASSTKKRSDFTASCLIGIHNERVYVIHVDRARIRPSDVLDLIMERAASDPPGTLTSIPQDPAQAGSAQAEFFAQALAGHWVEFSPESGDKRTRSGPIATQVAARNVYIARGGWNHEFLDELRHFPSVSHDDQVDALSRAYATAVAKSLTTPLASPVFGARTRTRARYR